MVDSHKVWLIASISIAILIIAGLVFVPMMQENFAGQATSSTSPRSTSSTSPSLASSTEEFKCPTCAVLPSSDQSYLGGYTDDCCKMVPGCMWVGSSTDRNNPGKCVSITNQQQEGPAKGCADYSSFYKFGAIPDKARVQSCVGPCEYSVIDKVCKGGIEFSCDDGRDNDGDRLVDCIDPDCTEICNTPPTPPDCTANCDGKVCGDDGCEGSCGTCEIGSQCFNGRCITHDETCDNGVDDDNDLAIDCADLDCKMHDNCLSHDACNEGAYTTFSDYPSSIKKGQSTYLSQINGFFDSNACFKLMGDTYGRTSVSLINLPYSYLYSCEQIYKGIPVVKVHGKYGVPEFYQIMYKAGAGIKHGLYAPNICPETLNISRSYLGTTIGKKGFWDIQEVRQCIDEGIFNRKLTDLSGNNKYPVNEKLTCTSQVFALVCEPSCDGNNCGDDGCGGVCGTCPTDQTCQSGICTAQTETSCTNNYDDDKNGLADCDDPECFADENCVCNDPDLENELYVKTTVTLGTQTNTDKCLEGGQLREYRCLKKTGEKDRISSAIVHCPYGEVCQDDICVCEPSCTGKTCGDDGCGESCGTCDADESCTGGNCVFSLESCTGICNDGEEDCLLDGYLTSSQCAEQTNICLASCNQCTDADSDGYYDKEECPNALDCLDNDASVYPGASEVCDGKLNDCNDWTEGGEDKLDQGNLCGNGKVCTDGECAIEVSSCEDQCGFVGEKGCLGESIPWTCKSTSLSDCLLQVNEIACTTDEVCTNGECVKKETCNEECSTIGEFTCEGTLAKTCIVDSEGCKKWSPPLDCNLVGKTCQDGIGCASAIADLDFNQDNIIDEKDVQIIKKDLVGFRSKFSNLKEINKFLGRMRDNWKK